MAESVVISEILGKPSAILHSDGLTIFQKLQEIEGPNIILSFRGVTHCTTAFLNASIGKFIIENKGKEKLVRFEDVSEDFKNKIELVQDNARNEKKRNSLDGSSRSYFYA